MEILISQSGKQYEIDPKFAPEYLTTLISGDFSGTANLPIEIDDSIYDIIIPFFNTGKLKTINQEIIQALDFLGYDIPEYGFNEDVEYPQEYQRLWIEEYWVKLNLYKLPDCGNSTLISFNDVQDELFTNKFFGENIISSDRFNRIEKEYQDYVPEPVDINNFVKAGGYVLSLISDISEMIHFKDFVFKMEILSTSGKIYTIKKDFTPSVLKVMLEDDLNGTPFLPIEIDDSIYDIIIPFFNTGKLEKVNSEVLRALDFLGYDIPEYGFSEGVAFEPEYQIIWLEEYWVKLNFNQLEDYGNSTLIKLNDVIETMFPIPKVDQETIISKFFNFRYFTRKPPGFIVDINKFAIAGGFLIVRLFGFKIGHNYDIDYFHISEFGQPTQQEAYDDINKGISVLMDRLKEFNKPSIARTINSITVHSHYQFILRSYKSIAEVVYGFDVDCCGIIYYNKEIYMTPRCYYAIRNMVNTVDLTKCSPSYEYRLYKYWRRGFSIKIPGFDVRKINFNNITNLTTFEVFHNNFYSIEKEALVFDFFDGKVEIRGIDILLVLIYSYKMIKFVISDYDESETFLEITSNFNFMRKKKHNSSIIIGEKFIYTKSDDILTISEDLYRKHKTRVPRIVQFLLESPGKQLSGTFHRIVFSDYRRWFEGKIYDNQETIPISKGKSQFSDFQSLGVGCEETILIEKGRKISLSLLRLLKRYENDLGDIRVVHKLPSNK